MSGLSSHIRYAGRITMHPTRLRDIPVVDVYNLQKVVLWLLQGNGETKRYWIGRINSVFKIPIIEFLPENLTTVEDILGD